MSSSAGPRSPARVLPGCRSFVEVRRRSSSIPPRSSRCPGRGARLCGVGGGGRVGGETQAHGGGVGVGGGGQWWDAGMGGRQVSRMQSGENRRGSEEGRKEGKKTHLNSTQVTIFKRKKNPSGSARDKTNSRKRKKKKSPRCRIYIYTPEWCIYVSGSKGDGGEGQR